MTNIWIIKGYKGFNDCDGECDYNINYELEIDDKLNKEDIQQMLFNKYKKYRNIVLSITKKE